jgi:signal transduction histidine kinase
MRLLHSVRLRRHHLLVLAFIVIAVYFTVEHRYVEEQKRLNLEAAKGAVAFAEALLARRGTVSERSGELYAGDKRLNGDTEIVDTVKTRTGFGCTIFQGSTRIATNATAAGEAVRAIGTTANQTVTNLVYRGGGVFRGVTRTIGKDWVIVYAPLRDGDGQIVGMLATYRELDDFLKELNSFRLLLGGELVLLFGSVSLLVYLSEGWLRRIEHQSEEIARKNQQLEQALSNLASAQVLLVQSEKMASVASLAAGMAHEMNNPVGVLMSASDVTVRCIKKLAEAVESSEGVEQLKNGSVIRSTLGIMELSKIDILRAGERIRWIVENLKSFVGLDESVVRQMDLRQGIESILPLLSHQMAGRIKVVKELSDTPHILCHASEVKQALMNVLKNSCEAIEGAGTIRVRTSAEANRVQIEISDDGRGMSQQQLRSLFEFQFSSQGDHVRMGMGLKVAQAIIRKHDGTITATGNIGQGTTFVITLPVNTFGTSNKV